MQTYHIYEFANNINFDFNTYVSSCIFMITYLTQKKHKLTNIT